MPDSWKRQPGIGQQPQTLAAVFNRMAKHPRRFNDRAPLLFVALTSAFAARAFRRKYPTLRIKEGGVREIGL
jgi:hypothetical protein